MNCIQKSRTVFTRPTHCRFFNSCIIHILERVYCNMGNRFYNHSNQFFALSLSQSLWSHHSRHSRRALALQCVFITLDNIVHYKLLERKLSSFVFMNENKCLCVYAIRKWLVLSSGWDSAHGKMGTSDARRIYVYFVVIE